MDIEHFGSSFCLLLTVGCQVNYSSKQVFSIWPILLWRTTFPLFPTSPIQTMSPGTLGNHCCTAPQVAKDSRRNKASETLETCGKRVLWVPFLSQGFDSYNSSFSYLSHMNQPIKLIWTGFPSFLLNSHIYLCWLLQNSLRKPCYLDCNFPPRPSPRRNVYIPENIPSKNT